MEKLTPEQEAEKLVAEKKAALAKKIETDTKAGFLNPFHEGVNYDHFLAALGKKTVDEYCAGKLKPEQIEWLKNDLSHYKKLR
jgi:hypothetical protein